MSHTTTSGALRVLQQGDLLGGADLMPLLGKSGRKKRTRKAAEPKKLGFATALALVVQHGRQLAKEVGKTALSRCPRCGHVGPTQQDFGTRIIRGERRPQSWCRSCRKTHLPPLKAVPEHSGRDTKAPRVDTAHEKPEKREKRARRSAAPAPVPAAPVSDPRDGWLFPPEVLRGKRRQDS